MEVNLEKIDIINLVRSTSPYYDDMSELEEMQLGYYMGGFSDEWHWCSNTDDIWNNFNEEKLFEIYKKLKQKNVSKYYGRVFRN